MIDLIYRTFYKKALWKQIILALILGLIAGLILSPKGFGWLNEQSAQHVALWVALPGKLFLALIQMVVIPLVMSSIILGIAGNQDTEFLKRVGLRIFPYFVITTIISVIIGVVIATIVTPGDFVDGQLLKDLGVQTIALSTTEVSASSIPQRVAAMIPANFTQSTLDKDMFAVVLYSGFIGIAMTSLIAKQKSLLLDITGAVQSLSLKIVNWAMKLAPMAVFGLLCDITIRIGVDALIGVSAYVMTVLLGLLMLLCVYLLLVFIIGKVPPWQFLTTIKDAQLLAFSTSSSAAVMPLSMKIAAQKLQVKKPIAQFIIPLGATINMDGTALYQVIAALFLAQVFGVELSHSQIILLMLTTVGASIGSPSTPGVGIVILASVLTSFGIPPSGIALILGVDRILDMCRTTLNVTGDLTACLLMNRWLSKAV
ncbi:dicarboxylate/amino acid:cation symporter [Pseudoalteromonas luteoviolacea]|uniref:dicarboxylate/amino acid:cation symporter n=1 Tax=Pseudoalteromonas luteoviolacea TaxID=43657 RepID=UPI001F1BA113|nr:dicarboxylate/amino acid:cation symporter [Pseudoalteromonas luteoviolacea]MCF6439300.1 dicarboxylate/amino acid:cation symporter [Pseudoalteromonas luteoviolacea]